ncbi:hypothetical protein BKA80DRAFT_281658 [Phyllosticta citrichinensis]
MFFPILFCDSVGNKYVLHMLGDDGVSGGISPRCSRSWCNRRGSGFCSWFFLQAVQVGIHSRKAERTSCALI